VVAKPLGQKGSLADAIGPIIQTHNLTKIYHTGSEELVAVNNISLAVGRGEFVALMGPSGSGKSTFMNMMGCLDRPTSGSYLLDGRDVSRLTKDELADVRNKFIGFVFQGFNLLSRTTAQENVELPLLYAAIGAEERTRRAHAALSAVGLEDRAHHRPNELSGGQQQRVAIARALVNDPLLILADEPTGNLDSRSSSDIMSLFTQLNAQRGITIVVVTHDPGVAATARRVVSFHDGRVVEDSPHSSPVHSGAAP
jgi:putative ABC transport system ATP-binding protein